MATAVFSRAVKYDASVLPSAEPWRKVAPGRHAETHGGMTGKTGEYVGKGCARIGPDVLTWKDLCTNSRFACRSSATSRSWLNCVQNFGLSRQLPSMPQNCRKSSRGGCQEFCRWWCSW